MNREKLPILTHGEAYIESIKKNQGGADKIYPHDYKTARERAISNIRKLQEDIEQNKKYFIDEKVICLRLEPNFEAKSYCPYAIANQYEDMKIIGGRKYNYPRFQNDENKAKLYYVRTNDSGIQKLLNTLENNLKIDNNSWVQQIRSLNVIDLLSPEERKMGFDANWVSGQTEFILHPMGERNTSEVISKFFLLSGLKRDHASIRTYSDGITFISAFANNENIENVIKYNPLRSVHPTGKFEISTFRNQINEGPLPPDGSVLSDVIIGVFDSGIDEQNPYFKGFAENIDMVRSKSCAEHGTNVTGALLYGNIKDISKISKLETPAVSVKMYRVYPSDGKYKKNPSKDFGLYETIDIIEKVVKENKKVHLYNLSIGPKMPILDDEITRFTYALDKLTYNVSEGEVNPLFCVAVGNNGDEPEPLNRIEPPSDMVNGLSVGAYTYNELNECMRASYSCVGPGREGSKIKPDILEFGGSIQRPFISVSEKYNMVQSCAGTSLSAPYALYKIGKIMATSSSISPHMGRTLMIHCAEKISDNENELGIGNGYAIMSPEEMLHCDEHNITILYEGNLEHGQIAKLPIFAPNINKADGMVKIKWTITTIAAPESNDSDAYTGGCIEDTFYPNSFKYTFTKERLKRQIDISNTANIEMVSSLGSQGYKKSSMPDSKPGKLYRTETELRNLDLKWDTVVKKNLSMRATSINQPFLTLHAMKRNDIDSKPLKFFAAITIEAPKFKGDLYDSILSMYTQLEPIDIRNLNRIKI